MRVWVVVTRSPKGGVILIWGTGAFTTCTPLEGKVLTHLFMVAPLL